MIILGLDSATDILAVGIANGNAVVVDNCLETRREHASQIINQIELSLKEAKLERSDLEGVAAAIGPGSFTGLRIGLAAAKAIAVANDIPLVGVSTFEVIGWRLEKTPCVLLARVRKGEYYLCEVEQGKAEIDRIQLVAENKLVQTVGDRKAGAVGFDPKLLDPEIEQIEQKLLRISAGELARIGAQRITDGHTSDTATLEPLYVAPSQAERRHGKRRV
jgi:tRNA threonylcarbamoyladenosine biosynthesis protein TsaB